MKLIIAGSRSLIIGPDGILMYLGYYFNTAEPIAEIVSGGANGVDRDAEIAAQECLIPFKLFAADWETHGKAAGPIRNRQMAEYADALLLIWDGESRGSKNMKQEMLKLKKPVYEVILRSHNV